MTRLVVVSNRVALPGAAQSGGLATAMSAVLAGRGGLWLGWSGKTSESRSCPPTVNTVGSITYVTFDLPAPEREQFYAGYANRALWPLLHFRPDLVDFDRDHLDCYLRVNQRFADALLPHLRENDLIWVQDFHLIPLAGLLRDAGVDLPIGFFLHTPLPPPDLLRVLPGHAELLGSLLRYNLVGLQTAADLHAYLRYQLESGHARPATRGWLQTPGGERSRAVALPISIDPKAVAERAARGYRQRAVVRVRQELAGSGDDQQLAIGVDRLDYSKGLVDRFETFGRFLALNPTWHGRVSLLQVAPRSRDDVPAYRILRRELERTAGAINGRFAQPHWTPVRYVNRTYDPQTLFGLYRASRIGLVTPLRDGMNLVAKEYVAAQDPKDPGVLILSIFAGAASEMRSALLVNPHDMDGVAQAISDALRMRRGERQERWRDLYQTLEGWDIHGWANRFLELLTSAARREDLESQPDTG